MDFERGMEFAAANRENTLDEASEKDSSYSEEEQAKVIEGVTADVKHVGNKRKPLPTVGSKKEKIIAAYRKNSEQIITLVQAISDLEGKNLRQEEQIVEDIKRLRRLQGELLNALLLEQKGILSEKAISKEAWNLIA